MKRKSAASASPAAGWSSAGTMEGKRRPALSYPGHSSGKNTSSAPRPAPVKEPASRLYNASGVSGTASEATPTLPPPNRPNCAAL